MRRQFREPVEHSAYPAGATKQTSGSVAFRPITATVSSLRSASIPSIPPHSIYKRALHGNVLSGAMYTAAGRATDEELNARVPLSVGGGIST